MIVLYIYISLIYVYCSLEELYMIAMNGKVKVSK